MCLPISVTREVEITIKFFFEFLQETCEQVFSQKNMLESIVRALESQSFEVKRQALSAIGTAITNLGS
jgi:hypothetical protein